MADSNVVAVGCQCVRDLTQDGVEQTPLFFTVNQYVLAIVISRRNKTHRDSPIGTPKLNLIPVARYELWPCTHRGRQVSWKGKVGVDPCHGIHEVYQRGLTRVIACNVSNWEAPLDDSFRGEPAVHLMAILPPATS